MPLDPSHARGLERLYAGAPTNQIYTDLALKVGDGIATLTVRVSAGLIRAEGRVTRPGRSLFFVE